MVYKEFRYRGFWLLRELLNRERFERFVKSLHVEYLPYGRVFTVRVVFPKGTTATEILDFRKSVRENVFGNSQKRLIVMGTDYVAFLKSQKTHRDALSFSVEMRKRVIGYDDRVFWEDELKQDKHGA